MINEYGTVVPYLNRVVCQSELSIYSSKIGLHGLFSSVRSGLH